MAHVIFYEKPGCAGNARQKKLLEDAGHTVEARDLLTTPWTRMTLLSFFGGLPVTEWFNRNSPAVKSGEIVPEACDEATALALLQRYPLLIRRPLLEVAGVRRAGFDVSAIDAWIGLGGAISDEDVETCRHAHPCGHEPAHDDGC
ncbi:MAG: hypothetical protein N2690_07760 [Rhodocyclaceae bacterium]|nr:hypothetical protein [Rhodocyclaceae bacterium]